MPKPTQQHIPVRMTGDTVQLPDGCIDSNILSKQSNRGSTVCQLSADGSVGLIAYKQNRAVTAP